MIEFDVVSVTIDRTKHTVLVVDDNPATRYATARVLRAAGFKTVEADTGEKAIGIASQNVSAVVLDVNLPDIDGFQVCKRLREQANTAALPVIHLSATYVDNEHKVAGLNAGADAYLTHPAEPPILVATLQALVRARMAEERLRASEIKFRAIYSQADCGIALVDSRGCFSDANPALLRMLGRSGAEVLERPISEFAPAEWKPFVRERTEEGVGHATMWRESFPLVDADGRLVNVEWSMSPYIEPGLRVGVVSNVSDRMEFEHRQQQLLEREQAARLAAERYGQTKDDFIAVLSHELRNPLNAMMMALHMLLRKGVSPDIAAGLEVIQKNAKSQARIISDILDVSRINSGKLTLNREVVEPVALINASIDGMKSELEQRQLKVRLALAHGAGPAWIDPTRFQQVFWNILANAVKFSNPGGEIDVVLVRDETQLSLVVRDFGKGIEPEFIATIFDKFSQSFSPNNRSQSGLGLGMSIVKHLVELHSGAVSVSSDGPGRGTTVRVEIPMQEHPETTLPGSLEEAAQESAGGLRGLHVLIVEDDKQAREMLAVILRDRGANVVTAHDYDAAIEAVTACHPDVLVGDIGLPGKDGYELIRAVRSREAGGETVRPLYAVALTAFGRPEDRSMAVGAGFNLHMSKPLRPLQLISALERLPRHG